MAGHFALGLDFGTNSVRALIVNVRDGQEIAIAVCDYEHGDKGILLDRRDPNLARQHPADYLAGMRTAVCRAIRGAAKVRGFAAHRLIGIGVDATGSTPIPVDQSGVPLAMHKAFGRNLSAMAWLWKDHTAHAEAEQITALARTQRPHYLAKCGGRYSSEWFWSKVLHCVRSAPAVFDAAYTWVELSDWIPAVLSGTSHPDRLKRGICAGGHKAMCSPAWGGYPDVEFLAQLDPRLERLRRTLPDRALTIADAAGGLCEPWAAKLSLPAGIPIAIGAIDAHLGAVGSGIAPGTLVKILGTSSCDMIVAPLEQQLPDIPGLCGIVPESILPGFWGIEAGQSAVGDIFNWFVSVVRPLGRNGSHEALTADAGRLRPGESGLLALDWHNGNRCILADQRLTGAIVGLTLHSTPAEIYRALIESTAMGARRIMEQLQKHGVTSERVINCGGIAARNPLVMRIYADVTGRPMLLSRSEQTCALGAAMAGAVVAGTSRGGHATFADAMAAMTGVRRQAYKPAPERARIYDRLYELYCRLHDSLGVAGSGIDPSSVMKQLLEIRDQQRR